jgi:hypothetical protein
MEDAGSKIPTAKIRDLMATDRGTGENVESELPRDYSSKL